VLSVGMLAKIRRMLLRNGLSIREVSRRTGLSRNTVRQFPACCARCVNSSSNGKPLNNLFGQTYGGHNNIAYSSLSASAQAWDKNWAADLAGRPQTIGAYAAAVTSNPKHMYNVDKKYPGELEKRYKQLQEAAEDCGINFGSGK